ncbi:MAG: 3,4-dehydroadipyl-CoA semialdehyde dehydrogenase [Anaerolineae bacterium]|nr:3,4-dehydroadipyl-CoA semialdehyde dehydrogenase [Anaerolineae bacterium]
MITLQSYVCGRWVTGAGRPATLVNPSTEEALAEASSDGVEFGAALEYAREKGGPALRARTFAERAAVLKAMANAIHARRDELLDLAMRNGGNTRGDAKFDVDGAAGTLAAYAEYGAALGDARFLLDGEAIHLGRSSRIAGQHVLTPRTGVAVHVNAFNFPAWGLAEKAAVALLAGMPVIAKPATATALLAHRIMELFVESGALPEGAVQFIAGAAGDLIDRLGSQDVLAFTGGGSTGTMLRAKVNLLASATHVNVEADSLNAALLGHDVERGGETWEVFLADVARDMTQKTGQKCTAIRRVLVPEAMLDAAQEDLADRLSQVRVGNVLADGVTMGPVSTAAQLRDNLNTILGDLPTERIDNLDIAFDEVNGTPVIVFSLETDPFSGDQIEFVLAVTDEVFTFGTRRYVEAALNPGVGLDQDPQWQAAAQYFVADSYSLLYQSSANLAPLVGIFARTGSSDTRDISQVLGLVTGLVDNSSISYGRLGETGVQMRAVLTLSGD